MIDHDPAPLIEVLGPSCLSALPLSSLTARFPEKVKMPPPGPCEGPETGGEPRSPTPGMPERPVVGDCGKKLNESETFRAQWREMSPCVAPTFQKVVVPNPFPLDRSTPPAKNMLHG